MDSRASRGGVVAKLRRFSERHQRAADQHSADKVETRGMGNKEAREVTHTEG